MFDGCPKTSPGECLQCGLRSRPITWDRGECDFYLGHEIPLSHTVGFSAQGISVSVRYEAKGSILIVRIDLHRLDLQSAAVIESSLFEAVANQHAVAIDCSSVNYVDCFGFEMLLEVIRRCPGKASIVAPGRHLKQLIEWTHLHSAMSLYNSLEDLLDDCCLQGNRKAD